MRIDLTTASPRARAEDRKLVLFVGLFFDVFSLLYFGGFAYLILSGVDLLQNLTLFLLIIPVSALGYIVAAVTIWGRSQATAVEVDELGVTYVYAPHKVRTRRWADPKFRLAIDVTQGYAGSPSWGMPVYAGADIHYFRNYLPVEAYNAIVSQARAKGMRITETRSPQPGFTRVTITHPARRA